MDNFKLREFLSEGSIIRTKHCNSASWITNFIYEINDDWIEIDIGLEKEYIENMIMVGDTIRCKYSTDDHEFTLIGWVTRIRLEEPQSLTIKIHSKQFENKRNGYRYDVYLGSVVKRNKRDEGGIFAIMLNLSHKGFAFVVKEELEKTFKCEALGDIGACYFEIYISPKRRLCLEGILRRKGLRAKDSNTGQKLT